MLTGRKKSRTTGCNNKQKRQEDVVLPRAEHRVYLQRSFDDMQNQTIYFVRHTPADNDWHSTGSDVCCQCCRNRTNRAKYIPFSRQSSMLRRHRARLSLMPPGYPWQRSLCCGTARGKRVSRDSGARAQWQLFATAAVRWQLISNTDRNNWTIYEYYYCEELLFRPTEAMNLLLHNTIHVNLAYNIG